MNNSTGDSRVDPTGPHVRDAAAVLSISTPDGAMRELPVTGPAVVIGRAPDCDVVLTDTSVSRRHARIVARDGRYRLEDLQSQNGTIVGGRRVTETDLADGAVMLVGRSAIQVRIVPRPQQVMDEEKPTMSADQTTMPRAALTDLPRPPRLVNVTGQLPGAEFALSEGTITIGRGRECTIVLNDSTASRLHAAVSFDHGEARLVDRGGRHGTYVNGRRVRSARLTDGDLVQMGRSQFQYTGGAPPRRRHRLAIGAAVFLGLLILSLALFWPRGPVPQPAGAPTRDPLISRHYEEAIRHYQQRRWTEAQAEFEYVLGLEPAHAEARRYRDLAGRLAQAAARVETARRQLREGALGEARETVRQVLQEDPQLTEALEVEQVIAGRLEERAAKTLLFEQAERAFERGAVDEAAVHFRKILPSDERYHEAQAYLSDRLPARAASLEYLHAGLRAYRAGDADNALLRLDQAQGRDPTFARVSEAIHHIREVRAQSQTLRRAEGEPERWLRWLAVQRLLALEQDRENAYARYAMQRRNELEPAMDAVVEEALREARRMETEGDRRQAVRRYLAVSEIRPSDTQAHHALTRLRPYIDEEARRLYDEAYVLQDRDPERAIQQWRLILDVTPPDHPYHQKASAQLAGAGR